MTVRLTASPFGPTMAPGTDWPLGDSDHVVFAGRRLIFG